MDTNYFSTMSQVIPTLILGLVLEARYVLKSKFWTTVNYSFNKYVFSSTWITSLILMTISEIQIVQFLSGESDSPPNTTLISLGITFALVSIAINPCIEISIRVFNKTIAAIAAKIPYHYIRFLNYCWKKNISPSKRIFSLKNQKMESKIQQLEKLVIVSRELGSANPNFKGSKQDFALDSISLEVAKLRTKNLETRNMLLSPTRYNLELLDQARVQIKIENLANQLSNYW